MQRKHHSAARYGQPPTRDPADSHAPGEPTAGGGPDWWRLVLLPCVAVLAFVFGVSIGHAPADELADELRAERQARATAESRAGRFAAELDRALASGQDARQAEQPPVLAGQVPGADPHPASGATAAATGSRAGDDAVPAPAGQPDALTAVVAAPAAPAPPAAHGYEVAADGGTPQDPGPGSGDCGIGAPDCTLPAEDDDGCDTLVTRLLRGLLSGPDDEGECT